MGVNYAFGRSSAATGEEDRRNFARTWIHQRKRSTCGSKLSDLIERVAADQSASPHRDADRDRLPGPAHQEPRSVGFERADECLRRSFAKALAQAAQTHAWVNQ